MRTNSLSAWILAVRPYSLGNSVILVLVASAMAWTDGGFRPGPAALCLAFALLMQCTANLVNDLWDFLKGADRPDRLGPDRAFAKGYITLPAMKPQLMLGSVMQITSSFSVGAISMELAGFPSVEYAGHTLITHMQDYGVTRMEMGYASAIATILFVLMVFCNLAVQKLLRRVGE